MIGSMTKGPKGVRIEGTCEFPERKAKGPFQGLWHNDRILEATFNGRRARRLGYLLQDAIKNFDAPLFQKIKVLDR